MFTFQKEVTNIFLSFIYGDLTIKEFEEWVYSYEYLESSIGSDNYNALFDFDYWFYGTEDELVELIISFYKKSDREFGKEYIMWILNQMVEGSIDVVIGCSKLAYLRSFEKDFDYIPILFVGYDSLIEDAEYHYRDDFIEGNKIIRNYSDQIIELSKKFLDDLNL
ncbi:hypothetical protein [Clostridium beijerinckii]|uniref:Uncharacterized protein n=1 Tax=Clostridium beijerinckii TaxID=1520 RepID=A0AAX0AV14_CLOBE|nr:hypothetical protein [Clostridium beijerinckii]MBA8934321.1 hypothetical protein [Clostridium beijerinckii]NRT86840.1 hypothetical protein [Clostridium beijerinckii]NRU38511.1 hypothetical protein [Clostridium beijerinckii]NSA98210.1 hypothetical protein [Clostridium beijerinckii]NYC72272.1 hypothetical protein [Clostridium beijerinckii]